ncbi:hypothetical protein ACFW04_006581 [Cataglyphis niger]
MWIQLDGAASLFHVRAYLNRRFNGKWIGRGGPIEWPARSPDFYLWGNLKNVAYKRAPTTKEDMMERITTACRKQCILTSCIIENSTIFIEGYNYAFKKMEMIFEHLL